MKTVGLWRNVGNSFLSLEADLSSVLLALSGVSCFLMTDLGCLNVARSFGLNKPQENKCNVLESGV